MVRNVFTADPPPRQHWGSKCQNSTFSEHNVAYKIQVYHQCSKIVANSLPADPPPPPIQPLGSIGQNSISYNMVMLHIKLEKNHKCSNMLGHIFQQTPPPLQHWGSKCQNLCQEVQFIWNISNVILDQRPRSDSLGGLRGSGQKLKIQLLQNMVMLQIKLKGIKNAATW